MNDIQDILNFLHQPTPDAWLAQAVQHLPLLLVDHAHCERKAATTALNFINKYPKQQALIDVMSPLAREELLHFEKVIHLLKVRNIPFGPLKPSYYAQRLHQYVSRTDFFTQLSDELMVGALIEARSCERFHALVPWLDDKPLARFYTSLVKAEARHFQEYLRLARMYSPKPIESRLHQWLDREQQLIHTADPTFRFHGGIPIPVGLEEVTSRLGAII
jgi:tRNA-(ms[2]io[6]A)-hydroxylase